MAWFFLGVVIGALVTAWVVERFYRLEALHGDGATHERH